MDRRERQPPPNYDERFVSDWVDWGMRELAVYLASWWRFGTWLRDRGDAGL